MNFVSEVERSQEEEELIDMIEMEMRKIHLSVEKIYNNLTVTEPNDPIEKCLIDNYCYTSCVLEKGVNNYINVSTNPLKELENSLQKEIDYLANDISKVLSKMNEYDEMLSRFDKNISNLNAMMEASRNEAKSVNDFNNITKNIKMRFRKEKAELKTIISILFPENYEIQDIFALVIEHHFSEGTDKYVQLENTDNITEQIELLRRTNLFEINPHDLLQIRLADLV